MASSSQECRKHAAIVTALSSENINVLLFLRWGGGFSTLPKAAEIRMKYAVVYKAFFVCQLMQLPEIHRHTC
jgi:hypothetical protein